jgi:ubiquinone/menaquinone biosynthesis C-methylase UbiE
MPGHVFNPKDLHKLEDPERLIWLPPREVAGRLGLSPGMRIADIGAGSGFFAIPFAQAVAPALLFAVDLQPEMLDVFRSKLALPGRPRNIELVHGTAVETHLAAGRCDLVFLGNVWRELEDRPSVLREDVRILAPGGRLAILDWRADRQGPPGPPVEQRIAAPDAASELASDGWTVIETAFVGQYSYLVVAAPPWNGG